MRSSDLPDRLTKLVTPRALRTYAEGLGWQRVEGVNGAIAAYCDPNQRNRQLIVPLDDELDDYAERTAEAVARLAAFENRPPRDVLNHILVPLADVLGFREISAEAETGDIPFERGSSIVEGVKKALLAIAHSVEKPQAYHPRLSREEAKQFLSRCRMSTERGSFVLNVACLLDQPVCLPGMQLAPFTRRVTTLFTETLADLNNAAQSSKAENFVDIGAHNGVSANLCEALLLLRPSGDRASVTYSATWSRAMLPPDGNPRRELQLRQEFFELTENLAPRLRSLPEPLPDRFFGFVDELRGGPTQREQRPSGEVRFTLFEHGEELHAKADLNSNEYAMAGKAHLTTELVSFTGILHRLPRLNRIEAIEHFEIVDSERETSAN